MVHGPENELDGIPDGRIDLVRHKLKLGAADHDLDVRGRHGGGEGGKSSSGGKVETHFVLFVF